MLNLPKMSCYFTSVTMLCKTLLLFTLLQSPKNVLCVILCPQRNYLISCNGAVQYQLCFSPLSWLGKACWTLWNHPVQSFSVQNPSWSSMLRFRNWQCIKVKKNIVSFINFGMCCLLSLIVRTLSIQNTKIYWDQFYQFLTRVSRSVRWKSASFGGFLDKFDFYLSTSERALPYHLALNNQRKEQIWKHSICMSILLVHEYCTEILQLQTFQTGLSVAWLDWCLNKKTQANALWRQILWDTANWDKQN